MKYLKFYLLFIFVILFIPNAYASTDVNINSTIKFPYNGSNGTYRGVEIYNSGGAFTYNIGTRYNGKLSTIIFYTSYSFDTNTTYTITLNMATNDWRNSFMGPQVYRANSDGSIPSSASNWAGSSSITFVSRQKIKFNFTTGDTLGPLTKFTIYSTDSNNTPFTGESNWNLSSIILTIPTGSSGGGSSGGGSSTDSTNQDIINNSNQNTQDIINNNNDNTQSMIDNNNSNTQSIIDNQNENSQKELENATCPIGPHNFTRDEWSSVKGRYLNSSGEEAVSSSYGISPYIIVKSSTDYTISLSSTSTAVHYCLYTASKQIRTCQPLSSTTINFKTASTDAYLRISLGGSRVVSLNGPVCNNWEKESFDKTNDFLTDNSDPNMADNEISSLFSNVGYSDPLNYLLQLPTLLINKIVSLSDTCSSINLGTLLGSPIVFPCINLEEIIGSSVWNTIDVLCTVGLLVVIFKNLYQTFSNLLTMGGEKEAREKFNMPTPMEFLSYILGGDK